MKLPTRWKMPCIYLPLFLAGALAAVAQSVPALADNKSNSLETATIDVSDIVVGRPDLFGHPFGIEQSYPRAESRGKPEPFRWVGSEAELIDLIKMTVSQVHAGAFEEVEYEDIGEANQYLVIRARPDVLRTTREVIAAIRSDAVARTTLSVKATQGADPADGKSIRRIRTTRHGHIDAPWDAVRSISSLDHVTYVADYHVEIAQGVSIADPVIAGAVGGLQAELNTRPTADGSNALISGVVQLGSTELGRTARLGVDEEYIAKPPRTPDTRPHGVIQLPEFSHVLVAFHSVVPYGETLHIPTSLEGVQTSFHVSASQGRRLLAHNGVATGYLTFSPIEGRLNIPALRRADDAGDRSSTPHFTRMNKRRSVFPIDNVVEWMISTGMNGAVSDEYFETATIQPYSRSMLLFTGNEQKKDALRVAMEKLESDLLHPVTIELSIQSVGPEDSDITPRRIAGGRIPAVSGRWSSLLAGKTTAILADYEVEVAQDARIANPQVSHTFAGLACNVIPVIQPDSGSAMVSIGLVYDVPTRSPSNFKMGPRYLGDLQQSHTRRMAVSTSTSVKLGEAHRVAVSTDPRDSSRRIVIDLTVTAP